MDLGVPAALLVVGLLAAGLVVLTDWIRERWILGDIARIHALGEIQSRVATAHLWVEEYVTGDEVADELVVGNLERAYELASALAGATDARIAESVYELEPLADEELVSRASELAARIDGFVDLTSQRQEGFVAGEAVGVGSSIDVEYDGVFHDIFDLASGIDIALAERMNRNHRRSRALFAVILAAWIGLVLVAVIGLAVLERRRAAAAAALASREEELFRSRKLEAVGRLAGGVAHDINNYLAAITAQGERLRGKAADPWVAERVDRLIATAFKASALIRQLLAFTRRQPMRLRVIDLNQRLGELIPMMERLLGEDIRLEARLEPGLWPVRMDPSQIEQVVVNLLVNAREALPDGGWVLVGTANRPATGDAEDRVELTVADDGEGIPPEVRDKLFDPFFTTKSESGGSGLGLSTVYGIVTQSRGTIAVGDEPGGGARFTITLPRTRDAEPVAVSPSAAAVPVGGEESILLVDDNTEFRRSTAETLTALGYRVTEAGDGDAALAASVAADHRFDLVVSDVRMPGLSGPAMAARLRQVRPDLPLLFVSGSSGSSILTQGFSPGDFDILSKPFAVEELDRRIRELMVRAGKGPQD